MLAILVLASVAPACGQGGGQPSLGSGRLATPRPLAVQVAVDSSRAAEADIGPEGGHLAASSASGAAFDLVIPAGALLSTHTVTLTPIQAVTGMPLHGGLLAGAQLGPDGLLLVKPATLAIQLGAGPSGGLSAYGFGYRHDGAEFHLQPAKAAGKSVSIQLWHFSGAGVGAGSSGDAQSQAVNHAPTAPEDQVEQSQAANQAVIPLLLGWDAQLNGELGSPSPNLALLDQIYQQLFVFEAMATAAGRPDLPATLFTKMALALKSAAALALTHCISDPDPVQGLGIIRWIEWAQSHPKILSSLDLPAMEGDVIKCLHFKLDFSTTVSIDVPAEALRATVEDKNIDLRALTAVPLKFAPGTGSLKYDSFTWDTPAPIPYTVTTSIDREFTVQDLSFDLDVSDSSDPASVLDGMRLIVDFGDTTETIHVDIPNFSINLPLKSVYANGMEDVHRDDAVGANLFQIRPWTLGSLPVFAIAHQGCPCTSPPVITINQDTLFQLRHTPG